jgi:hypothetical protein
MTDPGFVTKLTRRMSLVEQELLFKEILIGTTNSGIPDQLRNIHPYASAAGMLLHING